MQVNNLAYLIPVHITLTQSFHFSTAVVDDDLIVSTYDGYLARMSWNGEVLEKTLITSISFAQITNQSNGTSNSNASTGNKISRNPSTSVLPSIPQITRSNSSGTSPFGVYLDYCKTLNMLGVVMSNGTAACIQFASNGKVKKKKV